MPELPEVETLRRQLCEVILGSVILEAEALDPKLSQWMPLLKGQVVAIGRRGKALVIGLQRGKILLHLRMTGRLLWGDGVPKAARLALYFPQGALYLIDPRRFATLSLPEEGWPPSGVDPLKGVPPSFLYDRARGRRLSLKAFLMDQRWVAGIGNIYSCEILHFAGLDPFRPVGSVSLDEWRRVAEGMEAILKEAIRCRGTTISDWRDLYGLPGEYQKKLRVYGRKGKPCPRCGATIERDVLSGRGTYFCPCCQLKGQGLDGNGNPYYKEVWG